MAETLFTSSPGAEGSDPYNPKSEGATRIGSGTVQQGTNTIAVPKLHRGQAKQFGKPKNSFGQPTFLMGCADLAFVPAGTASRL